MTGVLCYIRLSFVAVLVLLVGPEVAPAAAQPGQTPGGFSQDLPEADFLFGPPRVTVALRGSVILPSEGGDLFSFVQDQLTIESGAFRSPAFVTEVGIAVTPRVSVVGGFELARKTVASEYRNFVDNDLLPIEQQSLLRQNSLTGSIRFALVPRGRQIGRFAWIPSRLQPYVGAGGGVVFWEFRQTGDFVDFQDFRVFGDTFRSTGVSPAGHVFGGTDIVLYKRLMFSAEGRYQWARGELASDFIGFEPLDLSGFRASAGISFAF